MKRLNIIILFTILLILSACKSHYVVGWYQIADNSDNGIVGKVLFTASDFTDIRIDSIPEYGSPYIQGRIISEKRADWANVTEKLIGKRMGFVYNDSVVTTPAINARLESGNFQIITEDKQLLKSIYRDLVTNGR